MKRPRHQLLLMWTPFPWLLLLVSCFVLRSASGVPLLRPVVLSSIQIYQTHEWLGKPTLYFQCQGENTTVLPDVKNTNVLYTFKGEESWQPLTELPDKKCKRCGIYEKDALKSDDVFDEWELCPDEFLDGEYIHFKDKEFNATFKCPQCASSAASALNAVPKRKGANKKMNVLVITICVLASIAVIGSVSFYKYWQKRRREQDQARFLKLFEEGDDIEDSLDLEHVV